MVVATSFALGPLCGAIALFALADALRYVTGSETARFVLVATAVFADAIRRLTSPWISPSGATLDLRFAGFWGPIRVDASGIVAIGESPTMIEPTPYFVAVRIGLVILAVLLAAIIGWRGSRFRPPPE